MKDFTLSEKGLNKQKFLLLLFFKQLSGWPLKMPAHTHSHTHTHSGAHGPEEVEDGLSCKAPVSMVIDKDSYIPIFCRDTTVWERGGFVKCLRFFLKERRVQDDGYFFFSKYLIMYHPFHNGFILLSQRQFFFSLYLPSRLPLNGTLLLSVHWDSWVGLYQDNYRPRHKHSITIISYVLPRNDFPSL